VDNETSQDQILRMYKLGHEIPWDVRKAQPVPPATTSSILCAVEAMPPPLSQTLGDSC
jgi:hypothetical protein